MRKKYMMILLTAAMLSLSACGSSKDAEPTAPAGDTAQETNDFYDVVSYAELTSKVLNLGQYKGIEGEKTVTEVSDEMVQEEVWNIKKQYAELVDVERAAEVRNIVVIDYTGYVDGETSEGMQGTEYPLELGSGSFIPGFEEQLIGAAAGQDVEVQVTFPEDYHEELAGKDAVFEVHVHKVQEYVNEEWNDAFIRENVGYESEADMEATLRSELEQYEEDQAEANLEYELILKLVEESEFQVENADIDAYTEEMLNEYRLYASMYGMELDDYLQQVMGTDTGTLREVYYDTAAFRVKMVLALHEIAKQEGMDATEEECTAKLEELALQNGAEDISAVEAVYSREIIRERLIQEKAIGFVRENAVLI